MRGALALGRPWHWGGLWRARWPRAHPGALGRGRAQPGPRAPSLRPWMLPPWRRSPSFPNSFGLRGVCAAGRAVSPRGVRAPPQATLTTSATVPGPGWGPGLWPDGCRAPSLTPSPLPGGGMKEVPVPPAGCASADASLSASGVGGPPGGRDRDHSGPDEDRPASGGAAIRGLLVGSGLAGHELASSVFCLFLERLSSCRTSRHEHVLGAETAVDASLKSRAPRVPRALGCARGRPCGAQPGTHPPHGTRRPTAPPHRQVPDAPRLDHAG